MRASHVVRPRRDGFRLSRTSRRSIDVLLVLLIIFHLGAAADAEGA